MTPVSTHLRTRRAFLPAERKWSAVSHQWPGRGDTLVTLGEILRISIRTSEKSALRGLQT